MSTGRQGPCLSRWEARDFSFIALYFALLLSVSGCAQLPRQDTAESAEADRAPSITVYTDEIGRQVRLPRHPQRIISLAPSVTELLYLIGADDRLIGDTTYCNWPEQAKQKPRIGDLLNPNYEAILAARPDLIIASTVGNDRAAVMRLTGLGLPVYVSSPRSVETIFQSTLKVGRITDCRERAEALVAEMKARLREIRRRILGTHQPVVFYVTWFEPLLAPGKNTFETDVLRWAGVRSLTADIDEYYPRYSLEQLLASDPDVILMIEQPGSPIPDLKKLAGWNRLSAVQHGRVYVLSDLLQHPSPRFIDGVEELARKLFPERFR